MSTVYINQQRARQLREKKRSKTADEKRRQKAAKDLTESQQRCLLPFEIYHIHLFNFFFKSCFVEFFLKAEVLKRFLLDFLRSMRARTLSICFFSSTAKCFFNIRSEVKSFFCSSFLSSTNLRKLRNLRFLTLKKKD